MTLKQRVFPSNPFLYTYAIISIVDGLIMLATVVLSVHQSNWLYAAAGLLISIIVFVVLNKQCLRQLPCPRCDKQVVFEAGEGFVCKKCKIAWALN
ncbi:MAG: hypothetical protein Q9M16_09345 [Mariprofundus sp.]|nr:hypothetical protein [Mariprofundus sp.]